MSFEKGNRHGKGRPKGSKNALPDRKLLIELLDTIIDDLATNYDKLTTNQKIRILQHFNALYKEDVTTQGEEPRIFNILFSDADVKKAFND